MDLAGYVSLTRQAGLQKAMQTVANNIANVSTTGYQREGVVFAEMVEMLPVEGGSVAMTDARGRYTDLLQGALSPTGGSLDFAIEGEGYFTVMTPAGERLTRAGAFTRDANGQVVNMDGHQLLDEGGGPVLIPFEIASINLSPDGTLSGDGQPIAQLGLVVPEDPTTVFREGGTLFRVDGNVAPVEPGASNIVQGFVEQSNVNAVWEMTQLIEVQRAYEFGQKLVEQEDERIKQVVQVLGQGS
ncbi:flagellar hook-basal body complex protein [Amaricoccus macauensis]|uniref:flagellar hook-basal body complex protein n=1 Tax=Amaricoccus macauensis TaxID=57001 RepID=UPI003C7A8D50